MQDSPFYNLLNSSLQFTQFFAEKLLLNTEYQTVLEVFISQ